MPTILECEMWGKNVATGGPHDKFPRCAKNGVVDLLRKDLFPKFFGGTLCAVRTVPLMSENSATLGQSSPVLLLSRSHASVWPLKVLSACVRGLHSHVPFIGCKTLTVLQKTDNDIHGHYPARVEHLFARLWSWKIVHDIWLGSHEDLHANTHILLHFTQITVRRQIR